jgi:hypothetical protein
VNGPNVCTLSKTMAVTTTGVTIACKQCKIIRFRCSGKCQCNRKVIKAFGKIFFAIHRSESKCMGRILFPIFLYYSSNSESTVSRI